MMIIKTEQDREECTSCWGNEVVELTKEEIYALLAGETLRNPNFNEYGLFLSRWRTKR